MDDRTEQCVQKRIRFETKLKQGAAVGNHGRFSVRKNGKIMLIVEKASSIMEAEGKCAVARTRNGESIGRN